MSAAVRRRSGWPTCCATYARLESIGHASRNAFRLSLTQCQLADSVALSAVHVNRVLMQLRRQRVIAIGDGMVLILDPAQLRKIAGFDPAYLTMDICDAPRELDLDMNGYRDVIRARHTS